jgi:hypothetical protein
MTAQRLDAWRRIEHHVTRDTSALRRTGADPRGTPRSRDVSSQRLEAPGVAKANQMKAVGCTSSAPSDEVQIFSSGLFCCG